MTISLKQVIDAIESVCDSYAKPAVIEICDREIESYITDFCKKVGIQLVTKKQIKAITQARKLRWGK